MTFTVTLDRAAPTGGLTISVDVTQSGSYIDGVAPRTVTIPIAVGVTTVTLAVSTDDDNLDEADGSITVRITTGAGYTVGTLSIALVTVNDNDALFASISAADPTTITEGEVATFTVTLDRVAPAGGLTISVDVTDSGSYIVGSAPETVGIAEGATTGTLTVSTEDDGLHESDGSITVRITTGAGYTVGSPNAAMVTVNDNDDPAVVDEDGDGLIEIRTLAELNNIRYNLTGAAYTTEPGGIGNTNGCPTLDSPIWVHNTTGEVLTSAPSAQDTASYTRRDTCYGYELARSLDFNDANNDGNADDAYDTDLDTTNGNWTPIGGSGNQFSGTFEGNSNTISNMSVAITRTNAPVGLFGLIDAGAVIRDVGLVGASVRGGGANRAYAGGLVGQNNGGTIRGSYVIGSVSGNNAGGLAGFNFNGTIRGSYFTGSVSSGNHAGGLVGQNGGDIENSYATGSVRGADAGGARAGGLVGSNSSTGTIRDSYATGSVSGADAGGLVGASSQGTISNSYAIGPVNGSGNIGGLIGITFGVALVRESYWNTETSGQLASDGGIGQNTLQLVTPTSATGSIYESWTTESTALPGELLWDFGDNRQYPGLRLPLSTDDCMVSATTALCTHRPATQRFANFVETALTVVEGNTVAVDVALSYPSTEPVTVAVTSLGAAHIATSGAVTIPAGATTGTVLLATFGNRNNTVDNEVQVSLAMSEVVGSGLGYLIGVNSRATITVLANRPPVITSRSFSVSENTTAVGTVMATNIENTITGYAITGVDEASFAISTTGALTFNTAPDFENPQGGSANNSNTYELVVRVSNGIGIQERAASQAITVTVTDLVDEDGDGLIEIRTLTELNNIRYNLAGTSAVNTLVPDDPGSTAGCPTLASPIWVHNITDEVLTSAPVDPADYTRRDTCYGYELVRSLDFNDANNDGNADDAYDTDLDTTNGNWTPIADFGNQFSGTFEGNGNTISNMSVAITRTSTPVGLFGVIDAGAVIRDVGLVGASVRGVGANRAYAGGLVGVSRGGTISGSYFTGSVSGENAGGLAGFNDAGTISDSYFTGSVSSGNHAGGLVGQNGGDIENSYATGSVRGADAGGARAGGLVGSNSSTGTIRDSYATGSVRWCRCRRFGWGE